MQVGDTVLRMLAGEIPMTLKITGETEDTVECGPWIFDRATGAEIDEDLNWGPAPLSTGSYLVLDPEEEG